MFKLSRGQQAMSSLTLSSMLCACAVTTQPEPSPLVTPAQFKGQSASSSQSPVAVPQAWWQLFNDAELNRLQSQLVLGNETLKGLAAQVAQAKALAQAAGGARHPVVSTGLNANRADAGGDASGSARSSIGLSANASWEVDLWGRLSQTSDAAQARLNASQADLAAARLSAQATLSQTYLSLRAAQAQEAVLTRSIAVYTRSLELAQARYQSGVTAQTDVLQAQTQLKSAQIQLEETRTQQALLTHALASLIGIAPVDLKLSRATPLPAVPSVPALLPADLLTRRPDIAAAQARVKAAFAQVGVSEAALLPALTLNGSVGYRGSEFAHLISAPNQVWSLGASLLQTLLDGGVRRAATDQARAVAEQASSQLRQTLLNALVEVEDNLVLSAQLSAQAALQQEAVGLAARNLQITEDQYRVGTVSYVNVVLAQATALNSERNLLDLKSRQLAAVNQLLKNVAGTW